MHSGLLPPLMIRSSKSQRAHPGCVITPGQLVFCFGGVVEVLGGRAPA